VNYAELKAFRRVRALDGVIRVRPSSNEWVLEQKHIIWTVAFDASVQLAAAAVISIESVEVTQQRGHEVEITRALPLERPTYQFVDTVGRAC
jgi:hypothetical protein